MKPVNEVINKYLYLPRIGNANRGEVILRRIYHCGDRQTYSHIKFW